MVTPCVPETWTRQHNGLNARPFETLEWVKRQRRGAQVLVRVARGSENAARPTQGVRYLMFTCC